MDLELFLYYSVVSAHVVWLAVHKSAPNWPVNFVDIFVYHGSSGDVQDPSPMVLQTLGKW